MSRKNFIIIFFEYPPSKSWARLTTLYYLPVCPYVWLYVRRTTCVIKCLPFILNKYTQKRLMSCMYSLLPKIVKNKWG
jgi:hypothetical protein